MKNDFYKNKKPQKLIQGLFSRRLCVDKYLENGLEAGEGVWDNQHLIECGVLEEVLPSWSRGSKVFRMGDIIFRPYVNDRMSYERHRCNSHNVPKTFLL